MLTLVDAGSCITKTHEQRQKKSNRKPIILSEEEKPYTYNPFMGCKNTEAYKAVCTMSGTDKLVEDIKRLTTVVTNVTNQIKQTIKKGTELFSEIVTGPILQMPGKIKNVIKKYVPKHLVAIKTKTYEHSSSIGRLYGKCQCGEFFRVILSDKINKIACCNKCGTMKYG